MSLGKLRTFLMSSPLTNAKQLLTGVKGIPFGRMLWLRAVISTFCNGGKHVCTPTSHV